MRFVGAFEAKTHLSRLLDEAEKGEVITITKRGRPVARLMPPATPDRRTGLKSRIQPPRTAPPDWLVRDREEILALRDAGRR